MKLSELAVISAGQGAPQGEAAYGTEGIPFIKAGDLSSLLAGKKESEIQHINESVAKKHKLKLYPAGSILFAKSGMSCMKGYVYRTEVPCYVVSHLAIITPTGCNGDYLKYYFQFHKPNSLVKDAAYPSISLADIGEMEINLPTQTEQQKIVEELEKLTELIALRKEQLAKLDRLVKSRFIELFGDPVSNPMGWELQRFDSLCENLDSRRKPITASEREIGIYPYYGASGIVDYVAGYLFDEDILLVSEDGANLLMRSTPIAFSVSGKVWVNNHAHVVRFEKMSIQKYIEVFFSLIDISDHITGSAQPKLNQAKLNAMMFPVPTEERLDAFLQFIQQTDKSKLAIRQSLDKLELLKKSLMQEYFG